MAHFILSLIDGKLTPEIEGRDGEELTTEQVVAYTQMHAAYHLGRIADGLESIAARISDVADVLEQTGD